MKKILQQLSSGRHGQRARRKAIAPLSRTIVPILLVALLGSSLPGCVPVRRILTHLFSGSYGPPAEQPDLRPQFTGADTMRQVLPVMLTPVASGFREPTDLQFDPDRPSVIIVLEKEGAIRWHDLASGEGGTVMTFDVATVSEQGLLGLAFHPRYPDPPLFYVNLTPSSGGVSRILEVALHPPADIRAGEIARVRTVMEIGQPYQNHNAGQLAFGPDGYLYVGWGDGGWIGDPHDHGQNPATLLGKMLRIDPEARPGQPYSVPPDNPFLHSSVARPEIWASGLRNPWRYSFDPAGRLIVADVGQNRWEEIDIVEAGRNYGWRFREGYACYDPPENCPAAGLADPIYVYGREDGLSVTGGYVYLAGDIPMLRGLYVFGDFISGRIWALPLPDRPDIRVESHAVRALGQWPAQISTFGRDAEGRIYLADYGRGVVYRIDPAGHL